MDEEEEFWDEEECEICGEEKNDCDCPVLD